MIGRCAGDGSTRWGRSGGVRGSPLGCDNGGLPRRAQREPLPQEEGSQKESRVFRGRLFSTGSILCSVCVCGANNRRAIGLLLSVLSALYEGMCKAAYPVSKKFFASLTP